VGREEFSGLFRDFRLKDYTLIASLNDFFWKQAMIAHFLTARDQDKLRADGTGVPLLSLC
jgi:hypothetical protein